MDDTEARRHDERPFVPSDAFIPSGLGTFSMWTRPTSRYVPVKNIDTNITAVHRKKVFETCFIHHRRMIALRTIDFCSSVKAHYRQGRTLSLHLEPAPA